MFNGNKLKKVLLTEPIDQGGIKVLEGRVEVVISPDSSEHSVAQLMTEAQALIVRTATKVTRAMIEEAKDLRVISRTGGGVDNIDVQAATDNGVLVCGVKGAQDRSVAEHAVTLILALAKQLFYLDRETRKGNFRARFEYRPVDLAGKRVGIIGLGRIGRIVAEICGRGLGMEVWGYDPYVPPEEFRATNVVLSQDIKEVIRTADFVSLHVPLTQETQGLMGEEQFALMKPTAFISNTSRGEIIQEGALFEALKKGVIAGAGLDVYEKEPPDARNPVFHMENVIVSPHSAALTKDTVARLAEGAAQNVISVLEGRSPSYSVNWEEVQAEKGKR